MAGGVVEEGQVGAPGIGWSIVDAAVRIDLQHEEIALRIHSQITTAEACAPHPDEEVRGYLPQPLPKLRILHGNLLHGVVILPLHVGMLEPLSGGECELHGDVGYRVCQVVRVLRHQHCELPTFNELLDEGSAVFLHHLPGAITEGEDRLDARIPGQIDAAVA